MTIRLNLLPHRELKRIARQQHFTFLALGIGVLALLIVLLVHTIIVGRIDVQNGRNRYLETQITKLNKQIAEIRKLKEQTRALLARKNVVENLQANRAEVVHLLDQLARRLPEGLYLKAIKETGNNVNLQGYAQSSARVSTLMRSLEASPWLESPSLVEIKAATVNGLRVSAFSLNIKLSHPKPAKDDAIGTRDKQP
jgi:type IV pilus assembly protein PilN